MYFLVICKISIGWKFHSKIGIVIDDFNSNLPGLRFFVYCICIITLPSHLNDMEIPRSVWPDPPLSQGLDLALCLPLSAFAALFSTFFSLIWAVIFWSTQFGCSFSWLYFDKFRDTAPLVAGTKSRSLVTSAGESAGHCATVNDIRKEFLLALITIRNRVSA